MSYNPALLIQALSSLGPTAATAATTVALAAWHAAVATAHDGVKAADLGGSSAQSVILMIIVIALSVIQFRFIEKKVQY